ncbi:hypothetical protein CANMA_001817 [Candida margitis]|uniref:uncharacterized protein n=1 Tax=Candida margitis TaxID=1775924 RepID=UPI002227D304|nr:uncharacterized protein CANMA_001817 [Candida margitis]KAI5969150.1 hypothetical protein CANMA_001817 [Candida margitis]
MLRPVSLASSILTAGLIVTHKPTVISNDSSSKRNFYEDDTEVTPLPGTVVPAPASEINSLGENRIIDGISVRTTTPTENFFKSAREFTSARVCDLSNWLNGSYTKFNDTERFVTSTVSDLHYKKEDLLPNGIYVIVAALAGTIAARPRGVIAKTTFPVIAGLAAFKYFLPVTFDNTREFTWNLEQRKAPQVAKQQADAYNSVVGLAKSIEDGAEQSVRHVESRAQSLRQSIANITGLNLDEEVSKKK